MNRKAIAALGAGVSIVAALGAVHSVSAHTVAATLSAVCQNDGQYKVTFGISNGNTDKIETAKYGFDAYFPAKHSDGPFTLTIPAHSTAGGFGYAPGNTVKDVITVHATWPDGYKQDATQTLILKGDCTRHVECDENDEVHSENPLTEAFEDKAENCPTPTPKPTATPTPNYSDCMQDEHSFQILSFALGAAKAKHDNAAIAILVPEINTLIGDMREDECGELIPPTLPPLPSPSASPSPTATPKATPAPTAVPTPTASPSPAVAPIPKPLASVPQTGADLPWVPAGILVLSGLGIAVATRFRKSL